MRTVSELTGATVISTDRPQIMMVDVDALVLSGNSVPVPAHNKLLSTFRREIGLLTVLFSLTLSVDRFRLIG